MYKCPEYNRSFDEFVPYSEADIGYFHSSTCPYCHCEEDAIYETHSLTTVVSYTTEPAKESEG